MSEWIKYDGTNKPDEDAEIKVRFCDGWVSFDWERASDWQWHGPRGFKPDDSECITHYQIKALDQ